jgi:hypothetical protein
MDKEKTFLPIPSFFSQASIFMGMEALEEAMENTCTMHGEYFLTKGAGLMPPITAISIQ